jgi:hypothetical protein
MLTKYKAQTIKGKPARKPGHIDLNAQTGVIPSKPGSVSRWIFPHFAAVILLSLAVLWLIPHPEIIKTTGILTGADAGKKMLYFSIAVPDEDMQAVRSDQLIQIRAKDQPGARFGVITGKLQHLSADTFGNYLMAKVLLLRDLTTAQQSSIRNKERLKVNMVIEVKQQKLLQCIFKNPLKKTG